MENRVESIIYSSLDLYKVTRNRAGKRTGLQKMTSSMKIVLNDTYRFAACKVKGRLLWSHYYANIREPKVESKVVCDAKVADGIIKDLKKNFFRVVDLEIDTGDYRRYLRNAKYDRFQAYYLKFAGIERNLAEKSLEHYLAAKLLGLKKEDVYIDIGEIGIG